MGCIANGVFVFRNILNFIDFFKCVLKSCKEAYIRYKTLWLICAEKKDFNKRKG